MRLLVDQNLARRVAGSLRAAGHDVVHLAERGLSAADDDEVLALAGSEVRVLISEDTDFGTLLAALGRLARRSCSFGAPSRSRRISRRRLLIANLGAVEDELLLGAVVVFARGRIRVRRLLIVPPG